MLRINFSYQDHQSILDDVKSRLGVGGEFRHDFFCWVQNIFMTTIPVVVIEVDGNDTFVYMGNKFAYRIKSPTERFFSDFETWSLIPELQFRANPKIYDESV